MKSKGEIDESMGAGSGGYRAIVSQPPAPTAYDAARRALTAILENQGLRPTSSGGHIAVIDAAFAQLDPPLGDLIRTVDRMRSRRNRVEYPAPGVAPVTADEVHETVPRVQAVLDAAHRIIAVMPVWA